MEHRSINYVTDKYIQILGTNRLDKDYEYFWMWYKNLIFDLTCQQTVQNDGSHAVRPELKGLYDLTLSISDSLNFCQKRLENKFGNIIDNAKNELKYLEIIEKTIRDFIISSLYYFVKYKNGYRSKFYISKVDTHIKRFNNICKNDSHKIMIENSHNNANIYILFHINLKLDDDTIHDNNLDEVYFSKIKQDNNDDILKNILILLFQKSKFGMLEQIHTIIDMYEFIKKNHLTVRNKKTKDVITDETKYNKMKLNKFGMQYILSID